MTEDEQKTAAIVNALFEKIIRVKPAFRQGWPTETEFQLAKREWVYAFQRAGVSSLERLSKAYEKLVDAPSSFIPSPGEFLALCKTTPDDIGAPTLDKAYQEACEKAHPCYGIKTWSHEAVKMAYLKSDPFALRTQPASTTKPIFKKNYIECCEDLAEGKTLNRLEEYKTRTFTKVEMHWITLYQYYTEGLKREIDFPSKEIFEQARELYHEWIKGQKS